ncbi:MAG TPA: hypothetical protein VEU30_01055 [Thermoanaerobaculia bacterium]|nr:hypothetical protein [Thermoanaerobaculia bacterium]
MKRLTLLACAFVLLSCAGGRPKTNIAQPELQLYQLIGPADLNYPAGSIEVQFALRIANRSSQPITLRQIQMVPVSLGGPYRVVSNTYHFNKVIDANAAEEVPFWARAVAEGDAFANDANAPVSLRAVAQFQSPAGAFRQVLMKTFSQQGSGPRQGQ